MTTSTEDASDLPWAARVRAILVPPWTLVCSDGQWAFQHTTRGKRIPIVRCRGRYRLGVPARPPLAPPPPSGAIPVIAMAAPSRTTAKVLAAIFQDAEQTWDQHHILDQLQTKARADVRGFGAALLREFPSLLFSARLDDFVPGKTVSLTLQSPYTPQAICGSLCLNLSEDPLPGSDPWQCRTSVTLHGTFQEILPFLDLLQHLETLEGRRAEEQR